MWKYVAKKLVYAVITLYFIATVNFLIFQVFSPTDPVKTLMDPKFTPEMKDRLRTLYGLDEPITIRYAKYIINMFTLNFGYSFVNWRPVIDEIWGHLPATLLLLGTALLTTVVAGIPLGIIAASKRGTKTDVLTMGFGLFAWSVPAFFVQLFFLFFFSYVTSVYLGSPLFPYGGITSIPPPTEPFAYTADVLYHLILPVITITIVQIGSWMIYSRNIALDILTQDFINTARAKGFSERKILFKHAFRVMLPSVVTMAALAIPPIFTGAIITEFVFTWPGIGGWLLFSIKRGDYPAVQGTFFIFAILVISFNLIADLAIGFLDPRIRVGTRR
jgi:peptide/nickel transport system permease protein